MLKEVVQHCYNITQSYLSIDTETTVSIPQTYIEETQHAIQLTRQYLLDDIFTRWDPFSGEISFSYNGGKDCQVLLILYLGCLWEFFQNSIQNSQYGSQHHQFPLQRLPTVYIDEEDKFHTAQHFLLKSVDRYCLSLYESPKDKKIKMSEAFESFLSVHPETKSILIGVRRTDPYGETLKVIHKTDPTWPQFYRLQPLLHWDLRNVWSFLLYSGEEVCGLYELGFTSLGNVNNTLRNPHLQVDIGSKEPECQFEWEISNNFRGDSQTHSNTVDEEDMKIILQQNTSRFYPGWFLVDDKWERSGRLPRA